MLAVSDHAAALAEVVNAFPAHAVQIPHGCVLEECRAVRLLNESSRILVLIVLGEIGRRLTTVEQQMVDSAREGFPVTSVWLYVTDQADGPQFTWESGY
jgi:hypothetical protein